MEWFRGWRLAGELSLFAFISFSWFSVGAQVGDPLVDQMARRRLAEAWAPTVFQDRAAEFTQAESGFNPIDDLVGLFYDGDQDLRDNPENLFRLSVLQVEQTTKNTPVYFSVIESETHFYINYIFYHALDAGAEPHAHDTENILTVVEKDGSPRGRLILHITNAHGFGMLYGLKSDQKLFIPTDEERNFLPYLDRFSKFHNAATRPEYIDRTESVSFKAFIASKTHAIYKLQSDAWNEWSSGSGIIYIPAGCKECLADAASYRNSVRAYQLIDWDSLLETNLINAQMGEGQKEDFLKIFAELAPSVRRPSQNYRARVLPSYLKAGFGEERSKANLFHSGSFHTPYELADPAPVHKYFSRSPTEISQKYIFNTYLNDARRGVYDPRITRFIKPLRRASIFHFVSELWEGGSD